MSGNSMEGGERGGDDDWEWSLVVFGFGKGKRGVFY